MNKGNFAWSLFAAIAAFAASRAFLLLAMTPVATDMHSYFQQATKGVDLHRVAYRDFVVEYPPVAYWCVALPRWLSRVPLPRALLASQRWVDLVPDYAQAFRWEMLVPDVAAFVLLLAIVRRRRSELLAPVAWTYVLLTTILGHVLLDRLDVGLLFLLLAWASSWLKLDSDSSGRQPAWPGLWQVLAYAALGLGCSYKLIPIAMVPLVLIADVRALRTLKDELRLAGGVIALAAAALGPFAYYRHVAGAKLWTLFEYHRARGLEIESLWSTVALALRPLGLDLRAVHGYGSWNIVSPIDRELLTGSNVAMGLVLAVAIARACWPKQSFSRADAYRWSIGVLLALMLAAKVLSAQYLLWALPLAMLWGAEILSRRKFLLLCAGLLFIAALTTSVFPYLFFGYGARRAHALVPNLDWLPTMLLMARNLLLLAVFIWLAIGHRTRLAPRDELSV